MQAPDHAKHADKIARSQSRPVALQTLWSVELMTMQTQEQMRELDALERGELNRWLAVNLFGKHVYEWTDRGCKHCGNPGSAVVHDWPDYSEDPTAAMEVLRKCGQNSKFSIEVIFLTEDSTWLVQGWHPTKSTELFECFAKTLELAICLFARELFSK